MSALKDTSHIVSRLLQKRLTSPCPNLPALRSPLCRFQNQTESHPIRRRCPLAALGLLQRHGMDKTAFQQLQAQALQRSEAPDRFWFHSIIQSTENKNSHGVFPLWLFGTWLSGLRVAVQRVVGAPGGIFPVRPRSEDMFRRKEYNTKGSGVAALRRKEQQFGCPEEAAHRLLIHAVIAAQVLALLGQEAAVIEHRKTA